MANLSASWTTQKLTPVAPDLVSYRVALSGPEAQVLFVPFGISGASFTVSTAGDYVVKVAVANADGSVVEFEVASNVVTVGASPPAQVDAPLVVTLSLA